MAKKQTDAEQSIKSMTRINASEIGITDIEHRVLNEYGLSDAVRAYFQNTRQGTVSVKGRSDVAFSTRKPWKQKGTGRARAGSRRSPLWRKGGVTFGPQPRVRTLKTTRKVKRQVMAALLGKYLSERAIASLGWQPSDMPKTREAFSFLKSVGLFDKKDKKSLVLFVDRNDSATIHSFRNLPMVNLLPFDTPNVYELACGDTWAFLAKDSEQFKNMVAQWT